MALDVKQSLDFAWMSQAAYLEFSGSTRTTPIDEIRRQLVESLLSRSNRFAPTQADQFLGLNTPTNPTDGFAFISHRPNDSFGFSATVFKANGANEYTIAVRGTEPSLSQLVPDLMNADLLGIALKGRAGEQLISAYRYYKQLTTTQWAQVTYSGAEVAKLAAIYNETLPFLPVPILDAAARTVLVSAFINGLLDGSRAENIGLGEIEAGARVNFTGHSLGGHVATLLAAMVTEFGQGSVGDVVTYNAPGQAEIFRTNTGIDVNAIAGKITNIIGEGGLNVTAGFRSPAGETRFLFIEREGDLLGPSGLVPNHSIVKLSDSVALYEVFAKIDPALNTTDPAVGIGRITNILKAGSNSSSNSLEAALDSLRKLFRTPNLTPTAIDNREQYYQNLTGLTGLLTTNGALKPEYQGLTVVDLAAKDAFQIEALAFSDIGYRYALTRLNGFAIIGSPSLYVVHNESNTLGVYNPISGQGFLTADYIADRAAMLAWKNIDSVADRKVALKSNRIETYQFIDRTFQDGSGNDLTVTVRGTQESSITNPAKVMFGNNFGEIITGTDVNAGDRLYGAGGNDTIIANGGNDYVEGGAGNDTLEGGAGADVLVGMQDDDILRGGTGIDTYIVGQGQDRILDEDGLGIVQDATGRRIAGSFVKQGTQYVFAADPTIVATLNSPLTITFANEASVVIEDFDQGELGIILTEQPDPAAPQPTKVLAQTEGSDSFNYAFDNRAVTVQGLSGNDLVSVAAVPPGFPLPAQEGSVVEGGTGSDAVSGGDGNDRLFGGSSADLAALLDGTAPTTPSAEREVVVGNRGDDLVVGNAGNDWLSGGRGADEIFGGAGDDIIAGGGQVWVGSFWGGGGYLLPFTNVFDALDLAEGQVLPPLQDTLLFSAHLSSQRSDEILTPETVLSIEQAGRIVRVGLNDADAEDAADTIFAGAGNDEVWAGYGDDYVEGQAGADTIRGEEGEDTLFGGADADTIYGDSEIALEQNHGADYLDGGMGDDTLIGQGGADTLFGGEDNDTLIGDSDSLALAFHGADHLDGESGDDILLGQGGDDTLFGGEGLDELQGGLGDDYLDGGGGNDTLFGEAGADELLGGEGDDQLVGGAEADYLDGEGGFDRLFGELGEDILIGGADSDELDGGMGDDALYGDAGVDLLVGGEDNDTLSGGAGADTLIGGPGDDTYVIGLGDERDSIIDTEGTNRIRFGAGIAAADLKINQPALTVNLAIQYGFSAADQVMVENGLTGNLQFFEFADGSVHTLREVLNLAQTDPITLTGQGTGATLLGGSGNDTLTAGDFDTLDAGRGNDTLNLAPQSTTLNFSLGDGSDAIIGNMRGVAFHFDNSVDPESAFFTRLDPADPRATSPRDLVLNYGTLGDAILIPDSARIIDTSYIFDQGGFFSHVQLLERSGLALDWVGTTQDEFVSGTKFNDQLVAGGGLDTLRGQGGDDLLDGGAQNDTLEGGTGNDTLVGGTGSDTLVGGNGNDRYLVSIGDGTDLVVDNVGTDTLSFGAGVTLSGLSAELVNGTDGNIYLAVGYAPGETVLVRQNFGATAAEGTINFQFADGATVTSAELSSLKFSAPFSFFGTTEAIRITGSGFDDILIGSTQDDRLEGGAGNDQIAGDAGRDTLIGGAGDDLLVGNAGDDILDGGAGTDTYRLHRGMGRDLVLEVAGDLNTIALASGLSAGDLARQRIGDDLYLHVKNSRDGIRIQNYFVPGSTEPAQSWQVTFADGTSTPLQDVIGVVEETVRPATIEALIADFKTRAQVFYDSALTAGGYQRQPDGSFLKETIFDNNFSSSRTLNTVRFAQASQVNDASFITRETAQVELVSSTFSSSQTTRTFQELVTTGSTLVPFGVGGNQPADGGAGATQFFNLNSSQYSGVSYSGPTVGIFGPTSVINPLSGTAGPFTSGFRVFPSGTTPTYVTRTVTHNHFEQSSAFSTNVEEIVAGDADNTIQTSPFSVVDAGAGDDRVTSENGLLYVPGQLTGGFFIPEPIANSPGSLLYGNSGNDTLIGSGADDVLIGGTGSDTLQGGRGNDLYVAFTGDGLDEIIEDGGNQVGVARENVLRLPQGVGLPDLSFSWTAELRTGRYTDSAFSQPVQSLHAVLTMSWGAGDGARIVIPHGELNVGTGIDYVELGEGTRLPFAEVLNLAPAFELNPHQLDNDLMGTGAVYGGPGNDVIRADRAMGGPGRDTLIGTDGNDELFGALPLDGTFVGSPVLGTLWDEGNVYRGAAGSDRIWSTAGSDVFDYDLGDGYDTVTDLQHDDLYYFYGGLLDFVLPGQDGDALDPAHRAALLANQDTLRFGPGILPSDISVIRQDNPVLDDRDGNFDYLTFVHQNGLDAVRFQNWYMIPSSAEASQPVNQLAGVEFADGTTVWDKATIDALAANAPRPVTGTEFDDSLVGTVFDDQMSGLGGSDFIVGDAGNDVLDGGAGDDTYFFDVGFGIDTIQETGLNTFDVVSFGFGIIPEMLTLGLGSLLIRAGDAGDAIHIEGFNPDDALGSGTIEFFQFGNGINLTYGELLARGFDISGTGGNDTLSGTNLQDRINGFGGDDTISSGQGDDVLNGAAGNDVLAGGGGNDTYMFALGSGADVIEDNAGDLDSVLLGNGISPSDVTVTRSGATRTLAFAGAPDRLTLHQDASSGFQIERVQFFDGTIWDAATLEAKAGEGGNVAPVVATPIADQTADEDAAFTVTVPSEVFSDPGDTLTLRATLANGAALPGWLQFNSATGAFSGTPANEDVGGFEVTVTATDAGGLTASDTFRLTVANANDAPQTAPDSASLSEDDTAPVTGNVLANDLDVDIGTMLTVANAGTQVGNFGTLELTTDGSFGYTLNAASVQSLAAGQSTTDSFTYAAADGITSTAGALTVTIAGVNDAPVTVDDIAAVQEDGTLIASGDVLANDSDVDAGTTLVVAAGVFTGIYGALSLASDGAYTYTLNNAASAVQALGAGQSVTDVFTYAVSDGLVNTSGSITVSVAGANDAPVLAQPLADLTTTERQAFVFVVPQNTFSDVDAADTLSYTAALASGAALPSWLTFNASTRTFSGTAGEYDIGTFGIRIAATDPSSAQAADEFNLSVTLLAGVTLTGTSGQDTLIGGPGADTISGLGESDTLYGNEGADLLYGGGGADQLFGWTGNDTLYGGNANDTLYGDEGNDTLYGEAGADTLWGWTGNDTLYGGGGNDTLGGDEGDDVLYGEANADTLWGGTGNDTLYGGNGGDALRGDEGDDRLYGEAGADKIYGGTGNDYLSGGLGGDRLSGEDGTDVAQGGGGADTLFGQAGNDLLDAGIGGDTLDGDGGNDFLAAGAGADTIKPGTGQDLIAFNRGDGSDMVKATGGAEDTVSVGGGIRYRDLKLAKQNNHLVLNAGGGDRLTFKNWYAATPVRPVLNLQVIAEAMAEFNPASTDPLLNRKVQTFDFQGIVQAFDAARAGSPAVNRWAVMNALLDFHLAGSDSEALGGDLAYQYGKNGALAGISLNAAQEVIGSAQFGSGPQALRPLTSLQEGLVHLS